MRIHEAEFWKRIYEFFSNILFVLKLIMPEHGKKVIALIAIRILGAVTPAIQIYIAKLIIDELVQIVQGDPNGRMAQIFIYLGLEFGLHFLSQVLGTFTSVMQSTLEESFRFSLARRINIHASTLDISYFEDPHFYDQIGRVKDEAAGRALRILRNIYILGSETISLLSFGVILAHFGKLFLFILLLAVVPTIFLEFREAIKTYTWNRGWWRWFRVAEHYQDVLGSYVNFQELRLFNLTRLFVERFWTSAKRYLEDYRRHITSLQKLSFLKDFSPDLGYFAGLILVLLRAAQRGLTVGDVTMYTSAYRSTQGSLSALTRSIGELYGNHLFIKDLTGFLALRPKITIPRNPKRITASQPLTIDVQNVSFRYGDGRPPVLSNVSFRIGPGERLALVGKNGAGKTTIVKLLLRFYDPTEGRILINGTDLREIDLPTYYHLIGAIFQEPVHYEAKVREQIGYGFPAYLENMPAIRAAAKTGGAHDFIAGLPKEYETPLGYWELEEDTKKLSGGQWQRIALARASINPNAKLVILDEPTAPLDPLAEDEFFKAILERNTAAGIIFISHRFSTIRKANQIIVLEGGQVKETGTHEALLQQNGLYAQFFNAQAQWYQ